MLNGGKRVQAVIGDDYDIIGFDPRHVLPSPSAYPIAGLILLSLTSGIGFTYPSFTLFPDSNERAAWELRHEANPTLNATPDALAREVARWSVFGDLAKDRLSDLAQYVSTAMVSRDMLRITEAHGFDKLKYWGFSYGSVLGIGQFDSLLRSCSSYIVGITFAAMFPDKVDRLVVDGVVDTYDYYEGMFTTIVKFHHSLTTSQHNGRIILEMRMQLCRCSTRLVRRPVPKSARCMPPMLSTLNPARKPSSPNSKMDLLLCFPRRSRTRPLWITA